VVYWGELAFEHISTGIQKSRLALVDLPAAVHYAYSIVVLGVRHVPKHRKLSHSIC
jgi:hypothetical protein